MFHTPIIVFLLSLMVAVPAWADVNSDLLDAARKGDTATVQSLLGSGANVNATDEHGGTALMYAAVNGHTATVQALVDAGADVDKVHNFGKSAKMLAEEKGHTAVVDLLVQAGATQ
jgi:ankyrin repeat protein